MIYTQRSNSSPTTFDEYSLFHFFPNDTRVILIYVLLYCVIREMISIFTSNYFLRAYKYKYTHYSQTIYCSVIPLDYIKPDDFWKSPGLVVDRCICQKEQILTAIEQMPNLYECRLISLRTDGEFCCEKVKKKTS